MRGALTGQSRKRLNVEAMDSQPGHTSLRNKPALVQGLVHNKSGSIQPNAGPQNLVYSSAAFNANDLSSDQRVIQVDKSHLFTAVLKSFNPSARGGNYLRQHLYEEFLHQQRKNPGNLSLALQNAIAELNKGFQSLHPFNLDVLQSLQIAVAFVDFESGRLLVASNGGCRCILGRVTKASSEPDSVDLIADIGRSDTEVLGQSESVPITDVAEFQLDSNIDFLILASSGFWREVPPFKAALRAHHFFSIAPFASNNSAAANLINYALHRVTQRMKGHADRRMVSLNSVSNLVSLQAGNKGQFKYGHKQPVRRRRGDVHDDMTTIVAQFDWQGTTHVASQLGAKRSKWAVVRMVYQFIIASRKKNLSTWKSIVSQVVQQAQEAKAKNQSMTLLKQSLHACGSRSSNESSGSEVSSF